MKTKALLFLFSLISLSISAKDIKLDNITYKTLEKTSNVEVSKCKRSGDIVIPQTVTDGKNTYTVVAVGKKAFAQIPEGFSVTLPSTVKTIGPEAFANSCLTNISMPGVVSIDANAFFNCKNLKRLAIPPTVTSIYGAFQSTPLEWLVICDSDSELTLDGTLPMFGAGAEKVYLGRPLSYSVFPFGGNFNEKLKKFLFRKGFKFEWEKGHSPKVFPGFAPEGCAPSSDMTENDYAVLEKEMDVRTAESAQRYEQMLKEREEQKRIEAAQARENQLAEIKAFMKKYPRYYKQTGNTFVIKSNPEPEMEMYEGDYSNPLPGLLNGPQRSVTFTLTPTTITITDVEEIQVASDFSSSTGAPKRPADPFSEYLECKKGAHNYTLPLPKGGDITFTNSCSHSMYKTKAGPYAPWRVKHTSTTTYNLNSIATKNKASVAEVLEVLIGLVQRNCCMLERYEKTPEGTWMLEAPFEDCSLDEPSDRLAFLYALINLRDKARK